MRAKRRVCGGDGVGLADRDGRQRLVRPHVRRVYGVDHVQVRRPGRDVVRVRVTTAVVVDRVVIEHEAGQTVVRKRRAQQLGRVAGNCVVGQRALRVDIDEVAALDAGDRPGDGAGPRGGQRARI